MSFDEDNKPINETKLSYETIQLFFLTFATECVIIFQEEASLSLNRTLILQILRNPVHLVNLANPINPASLANPVHPVNLANPINLVNLGNPAPALQEEASFSLNRTLILQILQILQILLNPVNLANPAPALQDEASLPLNRTLILQILQIL